MSFHLTPHFGLGIGIICNWCYFLLQSILVTHLVYSHRNLIFELETVSFTVWQKLETWFCCTVQCSLALPGLPHTQSYSGLHSMMRVDLNKLLNWNRISQNAQLEIQELFYNYSLLALWAAGLVKCRNALGRVDWQPPPSSHGVPYKLIEVLLCTRVSRITKCFWFWT